jgi:CRP/FNR family cyclic AMP-dependent transcriptional regulator
MLEHVRIKSGKGFVPRGVIKFMKPKKKIDKNPVNGKAKKPGPAVRTEKTRSEDRVTLLKRIRLFHSLTDKELYDLSPKVRLKEFKKNHIILHEEDTNSFMYIIVQGRVKIFQIGDEGKEMILSVHGAGEFFGEMSLIDGKTDPATVAAMELSLVAIISRDDFYGMMYSQTKILENLLELLCSRLRESWKKIQMLNFNDAAQRVKMLLLMLAEDYGDKTAEGTTLRIKLIHQNMADMTGLSRETVTRVLDRFKNNGEIKITKDKFIQLLPEFESIAL